MLTSRSTRASALLTLLVALAAPAAASYYDVDLREGSLVVTAAAADERFVVSTGDAPVALPDRVANPAAGAFRKLGDEVASVGLPYLTPVFYHLASPVLSLGESDAAAADAMPLLPDGELVASTLPKGGHVVLTAVGMSDPVASAASIRRDLPDAGAFLADAAAPGVLGAAGGSARTDALDVAFTPLVTESFPVSAASAPPPGASPAAPDGGASPGLVASSGAAAARATPAAALVAATAAVVLAPLLGWALYHRIRGHATLDNDTRKAIFDSVCAKPGMGVQEIADLANVSYSTASYHLDRLTEARMLVLTNEGAKLRYYQNGGAFNEEERKLVHLLKNAEAMRVFEAIMASPGTYRAALAESLGVTATTINWHLKRLVEAGLVTEVRQGRSAHLTADVPRFHALVTPLVGKLDAHEAETAGYAKRLLGASPAPAAVAA